MATTRSVYTKAWKQANRDRLVLYRKTHRAKRRSLLKELKSAECMDCHQRFHWFQMHFDHRPGVNKKFDIGNMTTRSLELVREEVEKCDLVCANCHALRTYVRQCYKRGA